MAGGHMNYRHLNRSSAHRQALLRNLVTSLIEHEHHTIFYRNFLEPSENAMHLVQEAIPVCCALNP
ncbi:putative 60S ribosomal protein L8, mitochondrial [Glarea lozoyensis 74030]|uniref:Putative 60S ribosomal protein L8, mitochondrial n=1 Tax=Glarea lozoyensis (strain ATCC 74030 / MF5533) TaxID=1104152 RepID=H0ENE3_GLAL7|nr:putative 60S ribosomal protein L8, mitochondrial [Glarea lozoyensis 74030]